MPGNEVFENATHADEQAGEIPDDRLAWSRPVLKRMNLKSAELDFPIGNDGFGPGIKS